MGIPRYTTPVFTLTFTEKDLDLTQADEVVVTIKQANTEKNYTGEALTVNEKSIVVSLSQQETAEFCVGPVEIQANWLIGNKRAASETASIEMTKQLYREVME